MVLYLSLKVFIEAAGVFVGEHQCDAAAGFNSNWAVTDLADYATHSHQESDLLDQDALDSGQSIIAKMLLPSLVEHTRELFRGEGGSFIQPTVFRFIQKLGRFFIARFSWFR